MTTLAAGHPTLSPPPPPRPRRGRWLVPVIAALAVLGVLVAAFIYWKPSRSGYQPAASPTVAGSVSPWPTDLPQSTPLTQFPATVTLPDLVTIADTLVPATTDNLGGGPVPFVEYEHWARDMDEMAPFKVQTWTRADYSAVSKRWKLPNRPPDFDAGQIGHSDFTTVEHGIEQTESKDIIRYATPLPADEAALFDRMRAIELDGHMSVGDVLGTVRWANTVQIPSLATRRAILRLIARLPGLTMGLVHDRLGRPGVAVTDRSVSDGSDYIYIFDTRTGELLACETMTITHGPGAGSVTLPALAEATVFHRRAFVAVANPA